MSLSQIIYETFGLPNPEKYQEMEIPEAIDPITAGDYDKPPLGTPTEVWINTHKPLVALIILGCLIGLIYVFRG